jgi:xanthine dehydrogenase accessory factor
MRIWPVIAEALAAEKRCVLVTVAAIDGSAPREAGARMIVLPGGGFHGTIGGGTLEWHALAEAQKALESGTAQARWIRQSLGPELGQCCGGRVTLLLELFDKASLAEAREFAGLEEDKGFVTRGRLVDGRVRRETQASGPTESAAGISLSPDGGLIEHFGENRRPVLLFGAGHVGRALILALAPLPLQVTWIDSRPDAFPGRLPGNVRTVTSSSPLAALAPAPAGSFVLIMTHSHGLDLEITHAALADGRFPYVGLIGSSTKRARFAKRLREAGIAEERIATLVCPIGVAGIGGKAPAIIAAATAAELLQRDELLRAAVTPAGILHRTA